MSGKKLGNKNRINELTWLYFPNTLQVSLLSYHKHIKTLWITKFSTIMNLSNLFPIFKKKHFKR